MLRPPFRQISASSTKILFHHEVCFHVVRFMSSQKPGITVEAHLSALRLEGKKRSRREHLRLRFYSFSRLQPHAAPYCRLNQRRCFAFEASGGQMKPDSPPTPRRAQPPERPSALHWFGSMRRAAIPPFHTVGDPSSFPARRASAVRQQVPKSRFQ